MINLSAPTTRPRLNQQASAVSPGTVLDALRRVRVPTYYVIAFLLVVPINETIVSAWPFQIHQTLWRITLVSSVANNSTTVLLALLLFFVVGTLVEDWVAVFFVATIGTLVTVLCIFGAGVFALDALEIRSQVRPDLAGRYELTSVWGLARISLTGLGALILASFAFRGARELSQLRAATKKGALVVVATSR